MSFDSFADFLAMGRHGLFVWSAYGLFGLVMIVNLALPWLARRRYLQDQARRLRRESQP
ncbi:heme exporter protein CcmD [Pseudomonas sp. DTU_2021_1001937_2_SI_NGA_ILE_001]|uniref:heme exporter protein CcmD n=1 Tax=Pseudomonas sp. DTU_2021_1001937_2_SI_NGA_ILE_001 TaxID=3077589 RepID=UPI0025FEECA8|nr:heme exporter protein CcmD [Pseudomonas sp. DTU_2021_1001937_2_SI_NGA_ILE_001]WNW11104.1 heme exporter protein CcmD [Pseudomonas sp. DTU_2021_1001937_2_SI_NGA_ILE_001]